MNAQLAQTTVLRLSWYKNVSELQSWFFMSQGEVDKEEYKDFNSLYINVQRWL